MIRVLIFGAFDLLHEGHKFFVQKAREYGDYVIASVARDGYIRRFKGRDPAHPEKERVKALQESGFVDAVCLSDEQIGSFDVIRRENPDVICLGYDQESLRNSLEYWLASNAVKIKVFVLPPFEEKTYKTSFLIEKMK